MYIFKSNVDCFLQDRKGEHKMKNTCMNCTKYHATLSTT